MKQQLEDQGYVILKKVFDITETNKVKRDALRIFAKQLEHLKLPITISDQDLFTLFNADMDRFVACGKHVQHLVSLHSLSLRYNLLQIITDLGLSFTNICTRPVLYFNHPRLATKNIYHTVPPHQDWASMQGSEDSVVVWAPLAPMSIENGALKVIPGSHKQGLAAKVVVDSFGVVIGCKEEDFIDVLIQPGDALLFSSYLIHKSGVHSNEAIRWSCHFRYNNMNCPTFAEKGFPHPYIYKVKDYDIRDGQVVSK